jgi:hypothetical protein
MKVFKISVVIVAALCLLYVLLQSRGQKVAKWRLDALHIVDPACPTNRLYSSGILRESTHVFLVTRPCLIGDAANADEVLIPLLPSDESSAVRLGEVQSALRHANSEMDLNAYNYFSGFDDPSLTSYALATSKSHDTVYIVVQSF